MPIVIILISFYVRAQNIPVDVDHPVYILLKELQLKKILPGVNLTVLPLSQKKVIDALVSAKKYSHLTKNELSAIDYYLNSITPAFPNKSGFKRINDLIYSDNKTFLYSYYDSTVTINISPGILFKTISAKFDNDVKGNSYIIRYGGSGEFIYGKNIGFYISVANSSLYGDRVSAYIDPVYNQSLTFNKTGLNNADITNGGLQFSYDIFNISLQKEKTTWGVGFFNREILSGFSQNPDYISFSIDHPVISYNFNHAWLVQPRYDAPYDSAYGGYRLRDQKYMVANRFQLNLSQDFKLGVSQSVVYANRGVELAYLNPFLFWESAQRSLEDIDNSFLGIDFSYSGIKNSELYFNLIFDDILFDAWKDFDRTNNRFSFTAGIINSGLINGLTLGLDYYFVRPYTYSHPGKGEALAYVNNGLPLGIPLSPNSDMISFNAVYRLNPKLILNLRYDYKRHGENIFDESGKLIKNVGGSFFYSTELKASPVSPFLDGVFQNSHELTVKVNYNFSYNINLGLTGYFRKKNYEDKLADNYIELNFKFFNN